MSQQTFKEKFIEELKETLQKHDNKLNIEIQKYVA